MKIREQISANKLTRISKEARWLVNQARAAFGLRAIVEWNKGYQQHSDCCPVAFAFQLEESESVDVGVGVVTFQSAVTAQLVAAAWARSAEGVDGKQVVLPVALVRFIRLFDAGYYPSLVQRPMIERRVAA